MERMSSVCLIRIHIKIWLELTRSILSFVSVVANEEMSSDALNLYAPKFRLESSRGRIPADFQNWYSSVKEEQLKEEDLKDLIDKIKVKLYIIG